MIDVPHDTEAWSAELRGWAARAIQGDVAAAVAAATRMRTAQWQVVITSVEEGWSCYVSSAHHEITEVDASFAAAIGLATRRILDGRERRMVSSRG
jgi:hypothetical protein